MTWVLQEELVNEALKQGGHDRVSCELPLTHGRRKFLSLTSSYLYRLLHDSESCKWWLFSSYRHSNTPRSWTLGGWRCLRRGPPWPPSTPPSCLPGHHNPSLPLSGNLNQTVKTSLVSTDLNAHLICINCNNYSGTYILYTSLDYYKKTEFFLRLQVC